MGTLGVLLYGYGEEQAIELKKGLERLLASDIAMYSASGKEDREVGGIIEETPDDHFEDKDAKVMLLLGFDDNHVNTLLQGFPEGIPRPIFCGLTEQNMVWTIRHLVEHLLEEDRQWKARQEQT